MLPCMSIYNRPDIGKIMLVCGLFDNVNLQQDIEMFSGNLEKK